MKVTITSLLLLGCAFVLHAQDTLWNFNPQVDVPLADTFPASDGYHTGHNTYGDEEFAEKYVASGNVNVLGLLVIHTGADGNSNMNASYKLYDVAANGLPGTERISKTIPNNNIPVDSSPFVVMFDSSVTITDTFFVSFGLGDYTHNNPGTKRIAITHSPNGVRPSTDFSVFGRNAIRWHSHGGVTWKDYRTENFQGYEPALHFSIFPIIEGDTSTTSVLEPGLESSVSAVYPNPTVGSFTVPVNSKSGGAATFQLFDVAGNLVLDKQTVLPIGKSNFLVEPKQVTAGSYILFVRIPEGTTAQRVIIQ